MGRRGRGCDRETGGRGMNGAAVCRSRCRQWAVGRQGPAQPPLRPHHAVKVATTFANVALADTTIYTLPPKN